MTRQDSRHSSLVTAFLLRATVAAGAATLATMAWAPSASALTLSQTLSLPGALFSNGNKTSADSVGTLSFNKFNTSLGTLQEIKFSGIGDLDGSISITRTSSVPSPLSLTSTKGGFALNWTDDFNAFGSQLFAKNAPLCTTGTTSTPCTTSVSVDEAQPIALSGSTTNASLLALFSGAGTITAQLDYLFELLYSHSNISSVQAVNYDDASVDFEVTLNYIYKSGKCKLG